MQRNPYSAPSVKISAAPVVAQQKKPKSAWLTQIVCGVGSMALIVGFASSVVVLVAGGAEGFGNISPKILFANLALRAAMLLIFVATIWGIQMRRRYGRLCGGLLIVTFLCWFMYQLLFVNGKSLNDAEVIGEFTGKMLFVCGAGYWFYAFCFSPAAQRYFSSGDELL